MDYIDYSNITTGVSQPFEKITWEVLQNSYATAIDELLQGVVGDSYDPTKVYILHGCIQSGAGAFITISAGAVYCAGEVYQVPTITVASPLVNPFVFNLDITFADTDSPSGTLFSDGIYRPVHQLRTAVLALQVSGTGNLNGGASANNDFDSAIRINALWETPLTFNTNWVTGAVPMRVKKDIARNRIDITGSAGTTGTPSGTLAVTIGSGYRPLNTIAIPLVLIDLNTLTTSVVPCQLSTGGLVTFLTAANVPTGANWLLFFSLSYPIV
jgi:hypothetical protein